MKHSNSYIDHRGILMTYVEGEHYEVIGWISFPNFFGGDDIVIFDILDN